MGGNGEPTSRWLSNKGCVLCRLLATKVVLRTTWGKLPRPPPAQVHGDLLCAGSVYDYADGWERWALYCSEDCRLCQEIHFFEWEIGIRN